MSLLWPDTVTVGLFAGHGWLLRSGAVFPLHGGPSELDGPQQALRNLDSLLAGQQQPLRKGTRVRLLISDGLAAATTLAWQELLRGRDELHSYALACFERDGLQLGDGWAVQTAFRSYRAQGLAYAVSAAWIESVLALLAARGLRLDSVLPLSAAAYWRPPAMAAATQAVLLREPERLTLMVYADRRLLSRDVQPITSGENDDVRRLLARLVASHPDVRQLDEWCAIGQESSAGILAARVPGAIVRQLPLHAWT